MTRSDYFLETSGLTSERIFNAQFPCVQSSAIIIIVIIIIYYYYLLLYNHLLLLV